MDEGSEVKPILIRVVSANDFGGLEKVFDLGLIEVRIALVDYLIQKLDAVPYAHLRLLQLSILFLLLLLLRVAAGINRSHVKLTSKQGEHQKIYDRIIARRRRSNCVTTTSKEKQWNPVSLEV